MKRFLPVVFFLAVLLFPSKISAQENWVINSFDSRVDILSSGEVTVSETIAADFGSLQKHGIFREIPYIYRKSDGTKLYTEIYLKEVLVNGSVATKQTYYQNGNLVLKIGDKDKTISGKQTYTINYALKGVLQSFSDYDELYWNVTGVNREAPVEKASAIVSLPSNGILKLVCFEGVFGSKESCDFGQTEELASFSTKRSLNATEGLTIVVDYQKDLVPILSGKKPYSALEHLFELPNVVVFALTLLAGLTFVAVLWYKRGRDFWWRNRFTTGSVADQEVKPLGGHETLVVEYEPPEKLRPAEIGALIDENAQTIDITATIVDLANRGHLTIAEEDKKWIFGQKDYTLSRQAKAGEELLDFEKELLDRLFDDGEVVRLSELKNKFYKDLKQVKDKLYENLVSKRFFYESPEKVRQKYSVWGILVIVFGVALAWGGIQFNLVGLICGGGPLVVVGLVLVVVAQFMPRKTALGRQIFVRSKGYKLFVDTAEKYRQRFFEKKNLFNEVLPYAIVFGVTEKFAKAFDKMGIKPEQPSWYSGTAPFNAVIFGSSLANFSNSVSSVMASAPSSSGGSGGFSGGGFGGGGSGSW